ncbi:MAG TPA: ABC transporter permease [Synergistaceae bacterium]|nr:ABC transporter permease [Synergistaceae bacterium]
MSFSTFFQYYHGRIIAELYNHLLIILISIPLSILISLPLGIFISARPRIARFVLYVAGVFMTIPSLALFGFMVVLLAPVHLGLGLVPAVLAIAFYSVLPITRNTVIALNGVPSGIIESARGMGLSRKQILWKVRLPLALPVIMAGVRISVVLGVSVATFASLVGAGGFGYFIFSGISRTNMAMVLTGAIFVSLLGIGFNALFLWIEKVLTPRGLKVER